MRTNKPSKYFSPAPVLIPKSTTIPLQAVVLSWEDIQTIIIHVGSDQHPASQNDIDHVTKIVSILDYDSYFQSVKVERHDQGAGVRPPNVQPPVYNHLNFYNMNQEIDNIKMTHPNSFIWILVGNGSNLASSQDIQCVMANLTHELPVSHHLMEFHCYQ